MAFAFPCWMILGESFTFRTLGFFVCQIGVIILTASERRPEDWMRARVKQWWKRRSCQARAVSASPNSGYLQLVKCRAYHIIPFNKQKLLWFNSAITCGSLVWQGIISSVREPRVDHCLVGIRHIGRPVKDLKPFCLSSFFFFNFYFLVFLSF